MHPRPAPPLRHRARRLLRLATVLGTALSLLLTLATPADAASITGPTIPGVTRLSNNALRLTWNGHTYTCYYGDLCLYRGGYQTYYACQTVTNTVETAGWEINNQYGSGGRTWYYGRNGAPTIYEDPGWPPSEIYWHYVGSIKTCTG